MDSLDAFFRIQERRIRRELEDLPPYRTPSDGTRRALDLNDMPDPAYERTETVGVQTPSGGIYTRGRNHGQ